MGFSGRNLCVAFVVCLSVLLVPIPVAAKVILPDGMLNRQELRELFSGKTVESVTAKKGRTSLTYYDPSGTVEQWRNGITRRGKWRISKGARICLQMENLKEKCRIIVQEEGRYKKYIVRKNGHHQHSVTYRTFADGNQL